MFEHREMSEDEAARADRELVAAFAGAENRPLWLAVKRVAEALGEDAIAGLRFAEGESEKDQLIGQHSALDMLLLNCEAYMKRSGDLDEDG